MVERKRIGGFTPEQSSELIAFMREAKASGVFKKTQAAPDIAAPEAYRVAIFNDSDETIPAYGCMQIDGTFELGNQTYVKVIKPNKTDGVYLFNNDAAIYKKSTTNAMPWGVVRMLTDVDEPSFDAGAEFAPVVGQWYVEEGPGPFVGYGPDKNKKKVIKGRIAAGSGGSSNFVIFEFDEDEYEDNEGPPELCADKSPTDATSHRVFVTNNPCGGSVPGIDDEGYITVTDPGEFLKDRDYRDLPGRVGFAQRVSSDNDYEYSESSCQWVIVWINFFREITMIKDIIFEVNQIRIKREKIVVWDNCRLPDEIITGADCQAEDEYA
jgi:hypothetical protein